MRVPVEQQLFSYQLSETR